MPEPVTKKPLIRQPWLRLLLFGLGFFLVTLIVAIPAGLAILYANQQTVTKDLTRTLPDLLKGNFLWLVVVMECLVSVITVWVFRVFVDRKSLLSLGLDGKGFGAEAVTGLLMGPALLGISSLLLFLSGHLEWVDLSWDATSLTISLGLLVMIAFGEELVFRGYVLGNLLELFPNKWIALAVSAFLFALFHVTNPGMNSMAFANLFLAGLLLGINYIYTRNLWFSLLFHISWNFFQGPLLGFNVSGMHLPSLLQIETKGDLLLTGGEFGLEGSVLNTAVSVIAVMILAWAFERKYNARPSITAPASPVNTPVKA